MYHPVPTSGCGKTTALKWSTAWSNCCFRGALYVDSKDIQQEDARNWFKTKYWLYVIQQTGLFPIWLSKENINYAKLKTKKIQPCHQGCWTVDMVGLDQRVYELIPTQMSGGQQPKVGVAGVRQWSKIILMDEPFNCSWSNTEGEQLQDRELLTLQNNT